MRTVLWLGGMSGVGKSTAARAVAHRYDLWLYSIDARTYAHAETMRVPALTMTPDELWLDRSPEQMAQDFLDEARDRFSLIRDEVEAIPDDGAPVLVEGPQLPFGLEPALYLVASPSLQRELLGRRGSLTYSATSDAERAFANRARRDELLRERLLLHAVEISDVRETEPRVEAFVREHGGGLAGGDAVSRRRYENDMRLDQWRRYAEHEPRARAGTLDFACECGRSGCEELVEVSFADAIHRPFTARAGTVEPWKTSG
jgi:hypothetical protein